MGREFPHASEHLVQLGGFDMCSPEATIRGVARLRGSQPFETVFLQAGGVVFGKEREAVKLNGHQVERTVFQNVFGGHVTLQALLSENLVQEAARIIAAGGDGARGIPGMIAKPVFASAADLRNYIFC